MAFLAVVLVGKGVHSLQEAGHMSVTVLRHAFRFEFLGLFPTIETSLAQFIILLVCILMLARKSRKGSQADRSRPAAAQLA